MALPSSTGALMRQVEALQRRVAELERNQARIPVHLPAGGGGSGMTIKSYATFPAIPEDRPLVISCKGQNWYAEPGYPKWQPQSMFDVNNDGTVGT